VYADLLGLRLVVHGVPLLGLLGRVRHSPLALSKLLRLANSSVRHGGCDEDGVGGCRVGGWVLRLMCGLASGVQLEGLWEEQALSHVIRVSRTDMSQPRGRFLPWCLTVLPGGSRLP
jgi:hypothetical protein